MKHLLIIPFFLLMMLACGPGKNEAIAVNDQMVSAVDKCTKAENAFFETCATYNPARIEPALKELIKVCGEVKAELEGEQVHEKFAKFKETTLHLVNTYVGLEKEYREYARLYSIPTENFTEADETQTSATAGKITDTLNKEYDTFKATQKEFSNEYGYALTKQ
jgi:hypothetical protein